MTIENVQLAIDEYGTNIVFLTLVNDSTMRCILQDVFCGSEQDPRGYNEPYLYVIRVDKDENPTEVFMCSEILAISLT
jgi:hypothetical protein